MVVVLHLRLERNDNLTEWPCTCDIIHSDLKPSWLVGILWEFWRLLIATSSPPSLNALRVFLIILLLNNMGSHVSWLAAITTKGE